VGCNNDSRGEILGERKPVLKEMMMIMIIMVLMPVTE
jgi:hypothetical protein